MAFEVLGMAELTEGESMVRKVGERKGGRGRKKRT
jgi:hypothetical protein